MALANVTITPTLTSRTVSWTIKTAYGNAIVVKWRKTGAKVAWTGAPMAELPKTATSCVITNLDAVMYDLQVTQVDYGTPENAPNSAPGVGPAPINVTPPVINAGGPAVSDDPDDANYPA